MSISPVGFTSNSLVQQITSMREQLAAMEKQLGTGLKADTYGGLGQDRGLDIAFRQKLGQVTSFQSTIQVVDLRLNLMDDVFTGLTDMRHETKNTIDPNDFVIAADGQSNAQRATRITLQEVIGMLNTEVAGRHLFSGRTVETEPVVTADLILEGDGTHAGLTQVIDERWQADNGATGLGRLEISRTGTAVTLNEDVAGSPFGIKLDGVNSGLSNVTVTGPTGSPSALDVDFTGQPGPGETITVHVTLPDGTTSEIKLEASATGTGDGLFEIGATPTDTATNFETALNQAVSDHAATELRAASAMAAGEDFFNTFQGNPPQRVDGPPFDTATALRDGSADTVQWYVGDNDASDPRSGVAARVDTSLTVGYGVRANEEGLRWMVQTMAVFSAESFTPDDATDAQRYEALADRARAALDVPSNVQSLEQIHMEIAGIHQAVDGANDRHTSASGMLTGLVEEIEGVDLEEVAASMITLQTRMQATYQATSMLLNLSLTNYI